LRQGGRNQKLALTRLVIRIDKRLNQLPILKALLVHQNVTRATEAV